MSTIDLNMVTQASEAAGRLFGRTREAVLGALLLRPDERLHLRQIARMCGTGLGAVQRELSALTQMGILQREQSGRQVYFRADRTCPYFPDLQGLIIKTTGVAAVMRAALLPVAERVKAALVFGSVARGAMVAGSDVDLLVLADDLRVRDLAGPIRQAGEILGREINLNLYRPQEWAQRVADGHPLARSILGNPRLLVTPFARPNRASGEGCLECGPSPHRT